MAGVDDEDIGSQRGAVTGNIPSPRAVKYIDHEDPFILVDQGSGDPNLRQFTRNAWVSCGGGVYVLECLGKGYIRITPLEEEGEGDGEGENEGDVKGDYEGEGKGATGNREQSTSRIHATSV